MLFFDELDSIAGRRDVQENESKKELLTAILSEMDGFEKISNVVIVGRDERPAAAGPEHNEARQVRQDTLHAPA